MDLDKLEYRILEIVFNQSCISNLKVVADAIKKEVSLDISEWRSASTSEPQWKYTIRKTFHSLKDLDLITGSELGEWHITKLGIDILQSNVSHFEKPQRTQNAYYRIIRNTKISEELKLFYNYECQICGKTIFLGSNKYYAEGHHLIPLGEPHNGPDVKENLIILCPNHHVAFDYSIMAINPETMSIEYHADSSNHAVNFGSLYKNLHHFNINYLIYHYDMFKKQFSK